MSYDEVILKSFKSRLAKSIVGRENLDEWINQKSEHPRGTYFAFSIVIGGVTSSVKIQNDTLCTAAQEFIDKATTKNIKFVDGPEGATRLGFIDGTFIHNFNVYLKK